MMSSLFRVGVRVIPYPEAPNSFRPSNSQFLYTPEVFGGLKTWLFPWSLVLTFEKWLVITQNNGVIDPFQGSRRLQLPVIPQT